MTNKVTLLLLLLATLLALLPTAESQTTTTEATTTAATTSNTTTTTNTTPLSTTSNNNGTSASLPPTTTVCQVVAFELRNANSSSSNKTVSGDCLPALSAVFSPVGGDTLACSALQGCGVIAGGGSRRRQTGANFTGPAINGTAEAIQVSFSAPVLLWQVDFGHFDAGLDTATLELASLYTNATVNFTAATNRWTALAVVIESGIEPPVVKSLRIRADSFSTFTLLGVRAKPYTPPPSIVFTTTAGNATAAANTTASTAEPTLDPNASFGEMLEFWMENEALYFWLVIAAIILLLICCIVAIVVVICCCCCGGDEEDEMYSMRDASSAYRDDDWL
jgi:hypothetical protein